MRLYSICTAHAFEEDSWMGKKKAGLPALSFMKPKSALLP